MKPGPLARPTILPCAIAIALFALASSAETAQAGRTFVRERLAKTSGYPPVGMSLVISAGGTPHAVYFDGSIGASGRLMYATKSFDTWTIEPVDTCGLVFDYAQSFGDRSNASIAVDSNGRPHVVYYAANGRDLKYATRSGGAWTKSYVDSAGDAGLFNDLAILSDTLYASYLDESDQCLRFTKKAPSGSWSTPVRLDDGGAIEEGGYFTSISVDPIGTVNITHQDEATGDLWMFVNYRGSAAWYPVWVDSIRSAGTPQPSYSSVFVPPSGVARIAYSHPVRGRVFLATLMNNADFVRDPVPGVTAGSWIFNYPELAVDAGGRAHIGLTSVYAMNDRGAWTVDSTLIFRSGAGWHGLALDPQGNPSILYGEQDERVLYYLYSGLREVAPRYGAEWMVGSLQPVSWFGPGPVKVELSTDGGATYGTMVVNAEASPVTVRVPRTITNHARIRVTRADPIASAVSDSFFTIDSTVTMMSFTASRDPDDGFNRIAWSTNPGPEQLAGYRIERRAGDGTWQVVRDLTSQTSLQDAGGSPGDRYRLTAVNGLGGELVLGEASWSGGAIREGLSAWPLPHRGGALNVSFTVPAGAAGAWNVAVFDVSGRRVRDLVNGPIAAGFHRLSWDGRDGEHRAVEGGLYFLVSRGSGHSEVRKLVVIGHR